MAIDSNAINWNGGTPPTQTPIGQITGLTAVGQQLLTAASQSAARAAIGADAPTDTRPPSTHDHDGRYYTEAEIDALMALKSATTHNHDATYYTKAQVDAAVAAQGRRKVSLLMTQVCATFGYGVITNDDQIVVWGKSENNTLSQVAGESGIPAVLKCNGTRTGTWTKLVLNRYNVFAVTSTGELWGMGDNTVGQLGLGDTTNTGTRYRLLHKITITGKLVADVVMAAGDTTNMSVYAVCTDGTLFSWGYNLYGQLGVNNTTNYSSPQTVTIPAGSSNVLAISVAAAPNPHVLVRTSDNKLHVCGYNAWGQLGLGDTVNRLQLTTVSGKTVSAVQANGGYDNTSAYVGTSQIVLTSGALQSAGYNTQGQLGNNSTTSSNVFINTSLNHTNVSGIVKTVTTYGSAGYITSAGIVWLVGTNGAGQLGNGGTTQSNVYVQPSGAFQGFATKAIYAGAPGAGSVATCAVLTNTGEVWATGNNAQGQCGDGTVTNRTTFARVVLQELITDIGACGNDLSGVYGAVFFALGASGRVYSWGYNPHGQAGLGHLFNAYVACEVRL